jgi:hypothetical protein
VHFQIKGGGYLGESIHREILDRWHRRVRSREGQNFKERVWCLRRKKNERGGEEERLG